MYTTMGPHSFVNVLEEQNQLKLDARNVLLL